jgi:hypothetical protein
MAALEEQMQATLAEKAHLAAKAEEKRLEERLREEVKQKDLEETRKRLVAAKSLSRLSVSSDIVGWWVFLSDALRPLQGPRMAAIPVSPAWTRSGPVSTWPCRLRCG